MKKYKILCSILGVRPGELHPFHFQEGSIHHIDDDLASQLYDQGALEMIEEESGGPEEKLEEKSRGYAPSNKNRGAAPSNKSKVE